MPDGEDWEVKTKADLGYVPNCWRFVAPHQEFSVRQWFCLPMEMRRRWWRQTDYGKNAPPPELADAIKEFLATDPPIVREGAGRVAVW